MKNRTTFVIAHRLATIRNATRILVFAGGRIVEAGNFDELIKHNGAFAELARSQYLAPKLDSPSEAKPARAAARKSTPRRTTRKKV